MAIIRTLEVHDRPRLGKRIRALRWHPVLRLQATVRVHPLGQRRCPARQLVPGPGHAWVERGVAFKHRAVRRVGTLEVVWAAEQTGPWVVLTDVPPERVGICWYRLRVWIEVGFRALKGVGWQWQQTRRTQPIRVARNWLVLAVVMLWVLAYGTRVEEANWHGLPPARLQMPPSDPGRWCQRPQRRRVVSLFRQGLSWLRLHLARGWLWRCLWLAPEPWPEPWPQWLMSYHAVA